MILNRLFLSEEYKQYLTFSVEISTNDTIIPKEKWINIFKNFSTPMS